jgi:iron(III) transport system ATP-binding protein
MSEAAITLRDVRRAYAGRPAVDGVSLSLPAGQITALLGPSGSGKSTLLRLIAGLEPVDGGEIRFGEEIVSTPGRTLAPERRRVGVVFQDYALFPHLTAAGNVEFGLDGLSREARRAKAREWLGRVGLEARADDHPHRLSGGEQQRVALARALAPGPRAVLLDEPFSGLDPVLRAELREITLAALRAAGATAVFVTHDAEEALLVADRLAIVGAGRLVQDGPPREVYARPNSPQAAAALGPVNLFAAAVEGGAVQTPFGPARTTLNSAAPVQVVLRCEALTLGEGGDARVIDVRPQGAMDLVQVEKNGAVWRALSPASANLRTGAMVSAHFNADAAHVFAS